MEAKAVTHAGRRGQRAGVLTCRVRGIASAELAVILEPHKVIRIDRCEAEVSPDDLRDKGVILTSPRSEITETSGQAATSLRSG
jgi:hypothetical protein